MANIVKTLLPHVQETERGLRLTSRQVPNSAEYHLLQKLLSVVGATWNVTAKEYLWDDEQSRGKFYEVCKGKRPLFSEKSLRLSQQPCPDTLAAKMLKHLSVRPRSYVLDPSAGTGTLLQKLPLRELKVTAVEQDAKLVETLKQNVPHAKIHCADFLSWETKDQFHGIVMFPPFAYNQDILHVRKAIEHLRPRGKLAAIMSPSVLFSSASRVLDFRSELRRYCYQLHPVDKKEFVRGVGDVRAALLLFNKRERVAPWLP